jgi:diaminobutyrate-2-oxoglutarate transaminase
MHDVDPAYAFVRARESSARTYAETFNTVFAHGAGTVVTDTAGRRYLDFLSCAGTLATGHNHPAIVERVQQFLGSGQVMQMLDVTTLAKHRFVERLFEILPAAFARRARVQFCGPTGADAIEAAIKLFKTATGRRSVITFHGGYHGMTAGALALTGNLRAKDKVASLMPDVHVMPYPYAFRCPFGLGAPHTARASLNYLESMLSDPESGITKPACVIVEAVQGEGGVIPAPPEWLVGLRALTARLDIPLVIDEVQTGVGRTGSMFGFEASGIQPDAIVLSKAIGGGFPIALVAYDERYDVWQAGAHAGTFRGNQIAMVAGAACLDVIEAEGLLPGMAAKEAHIRERLEYLAGLYPEIGEVRGRGLMWGIELVDSSAAANGLGTRPGAQSLAHALKQYCFEHGLLVETGGRHGAVLRLLPPLNVSQSEIDHAIDKIEDGLHVLGQRAQLKLA